MLHTNPVANFLRYSLLKYGIRHDPHLTPEEKEAAIEKIRNENQIPSHHQFRWELTLDGPSSALWEKITRQGDEFSL